jgi:hypothetical protein
VGTADKAGPEAGQDLRQGLDGQAVGVDGHRVDLQRVAFQDSQGEVVGGSLHQDHVPGPGEQGRCLFKGGRDAGGDADLGSAGGAGVDLGQPLAEGFDQRARPRRRSVGQGVGAEVAQRSRGRFGQFLDGEQGRVRVAPGQIVGSRLGNEFGDGKPAHHL